MEIVLKQVFSLASQYIRLNSFALALNSNSRTSVQEVYNRKDEYVKMGDGLPLPREVLCKGEDPVIIDSTSRDIKIHLADGFISFIGVPVVLQDGSVYGTLCALDKVPYSFSDEDVSLMKTMAFFVSYMLDRNTLEEQLEQSIRVDMLTHLPNKVRFSECLTEWHLEAKREKQSYSVLVMNVKRVKELHELLGYQASEDLLLQVSKRLLQLAPDGAELFKLEGDEFAFLVRSEKGLHVAQLVEDIYMTFDKAFYLNESDIYIGINVGVGRFPEDGNDIDSVLLKSYDALARVSQRGRSLFSSSSTLDSFEHFKMEAELRKALQRSELTLFYQPQYDLLSENLVGLEALIRWFHPVKGLVPPDQFIPMAEESEVIHQIGEWVLFTACTQAKEWLDHGVECGMISVNLSSKQFLDKQLINKVKWILQETSLPPTYLNLEITESMAMDVHHAMEQLNALKQLGVMISIDDFGKGYSSFSYLYNFPIDKVKIDKSFIETDKPLAIPQAIISMVHHLGMGVVAEGVETKEQVEFLKQHHCDEAQGYYFSKPLSVESLEKEIFHIG
ncbi:GGDEF domain-containing protein [Alkalihalobacillus sp. MEB130]|uniref:GGDEF domain-containing protein n=1 Tax=Alkalihalobacillus sp. MEB130 TaxID=2976704 RepID=UPI0028DF89D8|nr:GGDEF domain-containing protein [Alkalihalobacillus sp. MEB130]MDT8861619.1 GGDEF domain-containing protein [Alkalihalobacillus sp. MEB130]